MDSSNSESKLKRLSFTCEVSQRYETSRLERTHNLEVKATILVVVLVTKEQHHVPDLDAPCIAEPQRRNELQSTQKGLICHYGNENEPHLNFFGKMKGTRRAAPRSRARKTPLLEPKRPKPAGRKKRKLKVPKIPMKLHRKPPSYFELLQEAVQTLQDMSKGASLPQIREHLQRKYRGSFDKESNDLLTTALHRLAERGKVIRKEGFRYRFNQPNDVSESTGTSAASSFTGTNGSGASQSGASSGYLPTESGATAASSSFSDANHSKESNQGEGPENEAPENVDDAGKSSTGDLSSSAPSASSTASRASSKRR